MLVFYDFLSEREEPKKINAHTLELELSNGA